MVALYFMFTTSGGCIRHSASLQRWRTASRTTFGASRKSSESLGRAVEHAKRPNYVDGVLGSRRTAVADERRSAELSGISRCPDARHSCVVRLFRLDSFRLDAQIKLTHYHQTLRVTPATEAGIANHVWSIEEIVGLLNS